MKHIVFLLLVIELFSCKRESLELLTLPHSIELTPIEYTEDPVIKNPWGMKQIERKLLLFNVNGGDCVINVMDIESGKIVKKWGAYGNGPGEFSVSLYWGSHDDKHIFFLFDPNMSLLREYSWSMDSDEINFSLIREIPYGSKDGVQIQFGRRLASGSYAAYANYGIGKPILILNSELKVLSNFGDFPDDMHKSMIMFSFEGRLEAYKNKFVYAMTNLGYLACYEQLSDGSVKQNWADYMQKPVYNADELDRKLLKLGFFSVTMNDKYIFATYSGVFDSQEQRQNSGICPENILMFDYQGHLLENLHTKGKRLGQITLSEDGNTLYAVTLYPQISVVRYNISPYVK